MEAMEVEDVFVVFGHWGTGYLYGLKFQLSVSFFLLCAL